MVTLTQTAAKQYRLYLVRPTGDFQPTNWQQKPTRFKIVSRIDTTARRGKADAARFLYNIDAIKRPSIDSWYVVLS